MAALAVACQTLCAQSVEEIFENYKSKTDAEYVSVPSVLFKLAHIAKTENDDEGTRVAKSISSVRVLNLEDCSDKVKQEFRKTVQNFRHEDYETIVSAKEGKDHALILTKEKDGLIRELLVFNSDEEDCALIQIKGKIRPEDLNIAVDQYGK